MTGRSGARRRENGPSAGGLATAPRYRDLLGGMGVNGEVQCFEVGERDSALDPGVDDNHMHADERGGAGLAGFQAGRRMACTAVS